MKENQKLLLLCGDSYQDISLLAAVKEAQKLNAKDGNALVLYLGEENAITQEKVAGFTQLVFPSHSFFKTPYTFHLGAHCMNNKRIDIGSRVEGSTNRKCYIAVIKTHHNQL